MSLVNCVRSYINKMIKESDVGYKIMLMDKETTSFISVVLGMNEIMKQEVYMFEQLQQAGYSENMSYLKCIVFIRPTSENITLLCQELRRPRYGSYYIYISNVISKNEVKLLAEADEFEVVQEVQEIYADYLALSPCFFSLNIPIHSTGLKWAGDSMQRCIHGLSSILFSLRVMPSIRYRNNSELCRTLAEKVRQTLLNEGLLYSEKDSKENALLLILDRRDDPVSPLLHQWTYEAMVHELLGINNGRVKLGHIKGISEELKQVIMIPAQDDFYAKSMYLNYGEIGQTIQNLMEEYQKKLSMHQKVESITDMKNFVETYPQFKKMSGTVSKHVTVLGELSRLVSAYKLLEVSECQQELVCNSNSGIFQKIMNLIVDTRVREKDAVILVMLFGIRYLGQMNHEIQSLISALRRRNASEHYLKSIHNILEYGSQSAKQSGLFESDIPQDVSDVKRRFFKGLKGVDNVYTQHKPQLLEIINAALKGRLKESLFSHSGHNASFQEMPKPQVIVAYIIGGATHEEAAAVHQLNISTPGVKIYLGGSHVHNSDSFIASVDEAVEGLPRKIRI